MSGGQVEGAIQHGAGGRVPLRQSSGGIVAGLAGEAVDPFLLVPASEVGVRQVPACRR